MKMIEVLQLISEGKIKDQTILDIYDPIDKLYTFTFDEKSKAFYSNTEYSKELGVYFKLNDKFLNREVKLIPPKEKKYLVKFNMRGLDNECKYLNYSSSRKSVILNIKISNRAFQTHFTKSELQSIRLVREFLEDMQGKFELIEVEE